MTFSKLLFLSGLAISALSAPAHAGVNVVKVCNYRAENIWAADATQAFGYFKTTGWFYMQPGSCRDLRFNFTGLYKVYAYSASGWTSKDSFGSDNIISPSYVCVRDVEPHSDLDERVCENAPAGSGYRKVIGHMFNFTNVNYNVYEIPFGN